MHPRDSQEGIYFLTEVQSIGWLLVYSGMDTGGESPFGTHLWERSKEEESDFRRLIIEHGVASEKMCSRGNSLSL